MTARHGADEMTPALETESATLFAQFGVKAAALVDDHADLINAIARALLDHGDGELTGAEIDAIMQAPRRT